MTHLNLGTAAESCMPPRLAELQKWMRLVITDPRGVEDALSEQASLLNNPGRSDSSGFELHKRFDRSAMNCLPAIQESESFDRVSRLSIYAEAYFLRIYDSLAQESFSGVRQWVGEEGFHALVSHFLNSCPSRYWNIEDVAADFAAFFNKQKIHSPAVRNLVSRFPFLPELADFEWMLIDSFFSDRDEALGLPAPHDKTNWGSCTFEFKKHVRLRSYNWAVDALCAPAPDRFRIDAEQQSGMRCDPTLEKHFALPCFLLIYRDAELAVQTRALCQLQHGILQALMSGASLEAALEFDEAALSSSGKQAELEAEDVQRWFNDWMQLGIVASVR